jgi:ABC-type spermidine/putrescine transport system permease subunit II
MFAFLGLGTQEVLLLAILAALIVGVPLVVVLVATRMSGNRSTRVSALEEENRRLRAELDRDRPPPP